MRNEGAVVLYGAAALKMFFDVAKKESAKDKSDTLPELVAHVTTYAFALTPEERIVASTWKDTAWASAKRKASGLASGSKPSKKVNTEDAAKAKLASLLTN